LQAALSSLALAGVGGGSLLLQTTPLTLRFFKVTNLTAFLEFNNAYVSSIKFIASKNPLFMCFFNPS
jgi:hypothetical protein